MQLNNLKQQWMEENGLPASGDGEEACSAVVLLSSAYDFPFCFSFCFCDDEGDDFLFGFFFFWFAGGDQEDGDVNVGLLGFLLAFVSVFALCAVFFSVFLGFLFLLLGSPFFSSSLPPARLPLPSFYKARDSPGGGNGRPPKCSVTDAFNEETYALVANGWNGGRRQWTVVQETAPFSIQPLISIWSLKFWNFCN